MTALLDTTVHSQRRSGASRVEYLSGSTELDGSGPLVANIWVGVGTGRPVHTIVVTLDSILCSAHVVVHGLLIAMGASALLL